MALGVVLIWRGDITVGALVASLILTWREEIERRLELPDYRSKTVKVQLSRTDQCIIVSIDDQGTGFGWQSYLRIDPARATENHGRGIAHANMHSFNQLIYNDAGNKVSAITDMAPPLEW